jgi:hypothetical protein
MTNSKIHPRRQFLKLAGTAAGFGTMAVAFPLWALADDLPHLPESDPTAVALGYKEDATKVDVAKYPTFKAGQVCSNCKFFTGTDKTPWAGCQLFPGKEVATKGWCSGYNAKT